MGGREGARRALLACRLPHRRASTPVASGARVAPPLHEPWPAPATPPLRPHDPHPHPRPRCNPTQRIRTNEGDLAVASIREAPSVPEPVFRPPWQPLRYLLEVPIAPHALILFLLYATMFSGEGGKRGWGLGAGCSVVRGWGWWCGQW
jgi:hypothetical protein